MIPVRHKRIQEVVDMEDYNDYYVDIEGNIWSTKYGNPRKLKPATLRGGYLFVKLTDNNNNIITHYVHRLVALAFLPTDDPGRSVTHKNGDRSNNSVDNLEWVVAKDKKIEADNYILNQTLIDRIKQVHIAAQKKGIKVGNSYDFTTQMIEKAVESYVMQYGLRRFL